MAAFVHNRGKHTRKMAKKVVNVIGGCDKGSRLARMVRSICRRPTTFLPLIVHYSTCVLDCPTISMREKRELLAMCVRALESVCASRHRNFDKYFSQLTECSEMSAEEMYDREVVLLHDIVGLVGQV